MIDEPDGDDDMCHICYGYGRLEGCGDCEVPCTTEGRVICFRECWNCLGSSNINGG